MNVKIRFKGYLKFKKFLGNSAGIEIEMNGGAIEDVLETLASRFGAKFESAVYDAGTKRFKRSNMILVNGQSYLNLADKLKTELKDGDEVILLPVITGG